MILDEKCVKIGDTTCQWVSKVWNTIEYHKKEIFTTVINGKKGHEEKICTSSFAGKYIIVKNVKVEIYVCDYILAGKLNGSSSTKEEFLIKFEKAISRGFDCDSNLVKMGIDN